ncbi:hypothetical protein F4813DRAFT_381440 [Daldinia decipiens]|uniref:uncharacterized protein n=1 Tax=Daldinia decipiens TaxID=326647 RepID=UPI0020C31CF8|nr:uncharacterized protein F4813DRAFT_381440 [Daldinia decipiens]KAI1656592.1 hypothetical protein F4813DRAFT_381440 [Daldinia decipiens]
MAESILTPYSKNIIIFKRKIPAELSFENIIRGKAFSPCSLDDFMNYLMYIERSAENLQFFLWYCDYVERWTQLPRSERERLPVWGLGKRVYMKPRPRSIKMEERIDKLNRTLTVLDGDTPTATQEVMLGSKPESKIGVDIDSSKPRALALSSGVKDGAQDEWRWQPFSAQPFRDEVTEVTRQYISTSGPRKLNLSHEDRSACFHALQHTTHPSSFLLAFLAAETELRRYSHPNFIRWSTCNTSPSRVLCARASSVILIILAIILNIILILSKANRLCRLSAVPLWYAGFYILLIEGRGISARLYMNQKRQLRPWEQVTSSELESVDSGANAGQIELGNSRSSPESKTLDTWVELYRQKPIWQRIFDVSVVNHNRHLRALQDRVVFTSLFWACFLVVVLSF